jgi:hypothetical protein
MARSFLWVLSISLATIFDVARERHPNYEYIGTFLHIHTYIGTQRFLFLRVHAILTFSTRSYSEMLETEDVNMAYLILVQS